MNTRAAHNAAALAPPAGGKGYGPAGPIGGKPRGGGSVGPYDRGKGGGGGKGGVIGKGGEEKKEEEWQAERCPICH